MFQVTPPLNVTATRKQDSLVPTVTTLSDVSIDRVASPVSHDSLRPKPLNTRDTSNEIPSNPQSDCERSPRDLPEPLNKKKMPKFVKVRHHSLPIARNARRTRENCRLAQSESGDLRNPLILAFQNNRSFPALSAVSRNPLEEEDT